MIGFVVLFLCLSWVHTSCLLSLMSFSATDVNNEIGYPARFSLETCPSKLVGMECEQDFMSEFLRHNRTMLLLTSFEWAELKGNSGLFPLGSYDQHTW